MMSQEVSQPRMIIFAGPNGSGKTMIVEAFQKHEKFPEIFINADKIAECLRTAIPDRDEREKTAADQAEAQRKQALGKGESFAFETVLSTPGKLAFMMEAKKRGFHVDLIFITTRDPEINVRRVANRVKKGGHAVDPVRVRERYYRSMELLPLALELADTAVVFDNSIDGVMQSLPERITKKDGDALTFAPESKMPAWARKYLLEPYCRRQESLARIRGEFLKISRAETGISLEPADITEGGTYRGKIEYKTDHHLLQRVGAAYVIHNSVFCPLVGTGHEAIVVYSYKAGGKLVTTL